MEQGARGDNGYHFDSSSITVPGGRRRHFWHSSLSHCAHTSAASTPVAIVKHLLLSIPLLPKASLARQDEGRVWTQHEPARVLSNLTQNLDSHRASSTRQCCSVAIQKHGSHGYRPMLGICSVSRCIQSCCMRGCGAHGRDAGHSFVQR